MHATEPQQYYQSAHMNRTKNLIIKPTLLIMKTYTSTKVYYCIIHVNGTNSYKSLTLVPPLPKEACCESSYNLYPIRYILPSIVYSIYKYTLLSLPLLLSTESQSLDLFQKHTKCLLYKITRCLFNFFQLFTLSTGPSLSL